MKHFCNPTKKIKKIKCILSSYIALKKGLYGLKNKCKTPQTHRHDSLTGIIHSSTHGIRLSFPPDLTPSLFWT